jgi:hypothetical protein
VKIINIFNHENSLFLPFGSTQHFLITYPFLYSIAGADDGTSKRPFPVETTVLPFSLSAAFALPGSSVSSSLYFYQLFKNIINTKLIKN